MQIKIYLVRHGKTDESKEVSTPLTPEGRAQILGLCSLLPPLDDIEEVWVSPTRRTLETAEMLFSFHPDAVECLQKKQKVEQKVWNKGNAYEDNIRQLLDYLYPFLEEGIAGKKEQKIPSFVVVTHGRIIKMFASLLRHNFIHREWMDTLELDYGRLCVMEISNDATINSVNNKRTTCFENNLSTPIYYRCVAWNKTTMESVGTS